MRTGEEFLAFLTAVADGAGPNAPAPPPIAAFLDAHPAARAFVEAPKPIPSSFARQAYFAVTAFRFTNAAGTSRPGRFRLEPEAGTEFLTPDQAAKRTADFLAAELSERLSRGPARFRVAVHLAADGDRADDATAVWLEDRELAEFGTLTLTARLDELAPDHREVIFDPVPRVDGIDPAGDPLTDLRSAVYLLSGLRRRAAGASHERPASRCPSPSPGVRPGRESITTLRLRAPGAMPRAGLSVSFEAGATAVDRFSPSRSPRVLVGTSPVTALARFGVVARICAGLADRRAQYGDKVVIVSRAAGGLTMQRHEPVLLGSPLL